MHFPFFDIISTSFERSCSRVMILDHVPTFLSLHVNTIFKAYDDIEGRPIEKIRPTYLPTLPHVGKHQMSSFQASTKVKSE